MNVHPTAIVDAAAKVPASCKVGPFCTIGAGVELGEECELVSHVVIDGPSKIGARNKFSPFSVIGGAPQDYTYKGEPTRLEMGDGNYVREYVTISRGTTKGGGTTRVGSNCLIMAYTHIGHDCQIGNNVLMANGATLAGHVEVADYAAVGALSPVHQFVHIGTHAYIGGGTVVTQDVLPFSKTSATREVHAFGANSVGLQRKGYSPERVKKIQRAFRLLLAAKLNTSQAITKIRSEGDVSEDVELLIAFIEKAERGIIK
jgi:UDP-N-acetylglucosamine acyltransferase